MTWETLYNFLHIKDFIYFISSPQIQDLLIPVKIIFIFCAFFFLLFVIYFMVNSSWLQYKFLEDTMEFFSWQAYGQKAMAKKLGKIKKRAKTGTEADYKLAIIDADDFLFEVLEKAGYEGKDLQEIIKKAGKLVTSISSDILNAHEARNSIVYDADYKISADQAQKILDIYENAIKTIGTV